MAMEKTTAEESVKNGDEAVKKDDKKIKVSLKGMKISKKTVKTAAYLIIALLCWIAILQYATAQKYEVIVKVAQENEEVSANMNADKLDYGVVAKGESSIRFITIENRGKHTAYVRVLKSGDISDIMEIDATNFTLGAGETHELELTVKVPEGSDEAVYEGKVRVVKMPKLF